MCVNILYGSEKINNRQSGNFQGQGNMTLYPRHRYIVDLVIRVARLVVVVVTAPLVAWFWMERDWRLMVGSVFVAVGIWGLAEPLLRRYGVMHTEPAVVLPDDYFATFPFDKYRDRFMLFFLVLFSPFLLISDDLVTGFLADLILSYLLAMLLTYLTKWWQYGHRKPRR
jgi:hypothetical protein